MGGRYVKAYRTAKLASGMDHFLDQDELDAILAIMDADMFENNKDIESEIVMWIKKLSSRENCSFKCEFCPKVYQGTINQNIKCTLHLIVSVMVILVV